VSSDYEGVDRQSRTGLIYLLCHHHHHCFTTTSV